MTSLGQALGVVAQALVDLDDSHTFFIPPNRSVRAEYGWRMRMIGAECYVTGVKPGSDAATRGLKVGDRILSIDRFTPSRTELWKLEYHYFVLNPRTATTLVVQSPGAGPREIEIATTLTRTKRVLDLTSEDGFDLDTLIREAEEAPRQRLQMLGRVAIWKVPNFVFPEPDAVLNWALKDADALILDLRGNPGGLVKTLELFTGRFFDRDLTIADRRGRKAMDPMRAKKGGRTFTGRIVALIDSRSASAAEIFARLLQLEKRGIVIGDRSSGSVMQSRSHEGAMGGDRVVLYGASITDADVLMSDGKSLEHVGVVPDELIVPTGEDLAAGRDPVPARAAELLDARLDPATAGKLFPLEWK